MAKNKLLIAGGGYAEIPLIKAAKSLGYHVITSGNRRSDLGHVESDEYRYADFSNPDEMLELASSLDIDAICPCCNDFSAITSAYVAEKLGLPGFDSYETTVLLHHKDLYREFALENKIPTPKARGFSDLKTALDNLNEFDFPIIIKPVDLTGGKGIAKVQNILKSKAALEYAFLISKSKRIVIEEFIEGSKHGFSAILKDGKIIFQFVDNEHYYLNPYMVSGASSPALVHQEVVENLIGQSEKIASLLSLSDGIFHVQFILNNDGPIIIEICRRPPGDLYIQFVKIASGVDYPAQILKPFLGKEYGSFPSQHVKGFYTRHCIMADRNGVLKNINYDERIKEKVIDDYLFWEPGFKVESYMTTKFGIVFLRFDAMDEMLSISNNLHELIDIEFV